MVPGDVAHIKPKKAPMRRPGEPKASGRLAYVRKCFKQLYL